MRMAMARGRSRPHAARCLGQFGLLSRTPRRASWSVPLRHAVPPVFRSSIEMEALSFSATLGNADSETKLACTVAAVGGAQRLVRYMKCGQSQVGPGSLWLLPGT